MDKKDYNKYTIFTDRFPYIILAIILIVAVILVFQFMIKYPLSFLSVKSVSTQDNSDSSYLILVVSPGKEEVFDFSNTDSSVPIEIKSKEIEQLNYKLNLVINDQKTIKTFMEPPYEYNWRPQQSGEYEVIANLVDNSNKIISSSNKVDFIVNYKVETLSTEAIYESIVSLTEKNELTEETVVSGIPTINLAVIEGPAYAGDDICYYRIKATVTGNPAPVVSFSKDDSGGVWGPLKAQINLTKSSPSYTLTAIAKNSEGQAMSSINLNWK